MVTLPLKSKPLQHIAHIRCQLRKLPTKKPKTFGLTDALGRRKSSRHSLKINKTISNTSSHTYLTAQSNIKKHHNDLPHVGLYPKYITRALNNPNVSDGKLIQICSNESSSYRQAYLARYPSKPGSHPTLSHNNAASSLVCRSS